MNLTWLVVAGFLLFSTLAWATPPQDYTIGYTFKNPDGTVFRIIKKYLRDGNKFRVDYLSPVQYHVRDGAELQAEYLTDVEAHTVEISRKDKGLGWSLDPSSKKYIQFALRPDAWKRDIDISLPPDYEFTKTGETRLLDYPCDIYESVQIVKEDNWTNIALVAQGLDVLLKTELWQNGKLVQIMEATEFRPEKPAASLFEIPAGYKK